MPMPAANEAEAHLIAMLSIYQSYQRHGPTKQSPMDGAGKYLPRYLSAGQYSRPAAPHPGRLIARLPAFTDTGHLTSNTSSCP